MQSTYIIISHKRKPFAAHSLKTIHVNRISPSSVLFSIPSCIAFINKLQIIISRSHAPAWERVMLSFTISFPIAKRLLLDVGLGMGYIIISFPCSGVGTRYVIIFLKLSTKN